MQMKNSIVSRLIILAFLGLVGCVISANSNPANQCESVRGQEFIKNHNDVLQSSGTTFLREIENSTALQSSIGTLINHFSNASNEAALVSCAKFLPNQEIHEENARRNIEMLGLGETFGLTSKNDFCIREIDHTASKKNREKAKSVLQAISTLFEALEGNSKQVIQSYGLSWDKTFSNYKLRYQDPGHHFASCSIFKSHAYFSNNTWGVYIGITNESPETLLNDKERENFGEFISKSGSFDLRWQWCENSGEVKEESYGTGLRTYVDGPLSWSLWGENPITDNPALNNGLDFLNFAKEMIQDVDSGAANAIFLVPAVLCLFPLSLFHDTGLWTVFAFMIVTDFVNILPLFLRGAELVVYGRRIEYSMITWVYGNTGLGKPGAAETWVTACDLKREVYIWGILFIVLAIASMLVGVTLEVAIVRWLRRHQNIWVEKYDQHPVEGAGLLFYLRYEKKEA